MNQDEVIRQKDLKIQQLLRKIDELEAAASAVACEIPSVRFYHRVS